MKKVYILLSLLLIGLILGVYFFFIQNDKENKEEETSFKENMIAVIKTNFGEIKLELFESDAPKTVENFIKLSKSRFYDETKFHRVIKEFMIQGGDPTGTGHGGTSIWGKPFEDEFNKDVGFDKPGMLAMANSGPNTNGSQFFITTIPTSWLNQKHTIFGEVVKGYANIQKIENQPTGSGDRPLTEQKIIKASIKK